MSENGSAVLKIALDLEGVHVTGVGVTYQRTINLGDYNSAKYGADAYATLDAGADPAEALRSLGLLVKAQVREQAMPVLLQFRKEIEKLVANLPESQRAAFAPLLKEPSLEIVLGLPMEFSGEGDDAD